MFLDLSKAFDAVNHHIVFEKLKSLRVHSQFVSWTTSFLTSRLLEVKLDSSLPV